MTLRVNIRHRQGEFTLDARFSSDGGVTALFGRSGSGKTTIVNAIAGLVRPQEGRIEVDGAPVFDSQAGVWIPPHLRRLGYVFQEARLFPHMSVAQNLLYGQRFGGRTARGGASLADVVELLGVGGLLDRRPADLSGGEKQRVAIGRALLSHPRILLMDEPLASLDEARKQEILPYIERLRDEAVAPIVYVSHSAAEVRRLATTVVLMENGRVTGFGPPDQILAEAAGDTAESFGAATPVLPGFVVAREAPGLLRIATPAGELLVAGNGAQGEQIGVRIAMNTLLLAASAPSGLGACGVLSATVTRVEDGGGAWQGVTTRIGDADITTRATRAFIREHGIVPGRMVYIVVTKAWAESNALNAQS